MRWEIREILRAKAAQVKALKREGIEVPRDRIPRDFEGALASAGRCGLIAEVKFSSPSAGRIRSAEDPGALARAYERAGACAISVLTEERYFGGSLSSLCRVGEAVSLPVLRKDFLVHEIQVKESAAHGADAVLLIASFLSGKRLKRMLGACRARGISALVEVHDEKDLEKALAGEARIIGINNRDLETLRVDLATFERLAPQVPKGILLIAESGIKNPGDVTLMRKAGARAVLVGSALMNSADIERAAHALVLAGKGVS